jgi:PAS domain S-box-containing protein
LMEQMIGYTQEEISGKTSLELQIIQPSDRIRIIELVKKEQKISGMGLFLYPKNKQPIDCLIYSQLVTISSKNILLSVFSNITELKKQQAEIKLLSSALSQTANAIIITNLKGEIEYVNSSLLELTGYHETELLGKQPSIFKSDFFDTNYYKNLWETILGGNKWIGEFYNRKRNNTYFWDSTTISPIYNESGEMIKFIAIKEDITEKKQQQVILQKSEKRLHELNATKDKFFSIIAHDLMNPFNAMMGFTNLMIESIHSKEYNLSLNYASIIDQSSKRIYELLQNLLIWSKSQSGIITINPSPVKVIELIMNSTNVLRSLAKKKNIDFEILIDEKDTVCVDQNMIETVLRNMITNAIKFSNANDKIKISVRNFGDHLLFSISDNGIGMNEMTVKELFRLEKSSSPNKVKNEIGTGLGMIISHEFISLHKGKIWVESELGKGSNFYFTIPN